MKSKAIDDIKLMITEEEEKKAVNKPTSVFVSLELRVLILWYECV